MAAIFERTGTGTGYDDDFRDMNPEYETVWVLVAPEWEPPPDLKINDAPKKRKKGKRLKDWER